MDRESSESKGPVVGDEETMDGNEKNGRVSVLLVTHII